MADKDRREDSNGDNEMVWFKGTFREADDALHA